MPTSYLQNQVPTLHMPSRYLIPIPLCRQIHLPLSELSLDLPLSRVIGVLPEGNSGAVRIIMSCSRTAVVALGTINWRTTVTTHSILLLLIPTPYVNRTEIPSFPPTVGVLSWSSAVVLSSLNASGRTVRVPRVISRRGMMTQSLPISGVSHRGAS
jgi:hypothetical protein